jgi:hypothetical protein
MTVSMGRRAIKVAMAKGFKWPEPKGKEECVICGCTQAWGCPEGCSWIVDPHEEIGKLGRGLCDVCLDRILVLLETPAADYELQLPSSILHHAPINTLALALSLARGLQRQSIILAAMKSRGVA